MPALPPSPPKPWPASDRDRMAREYVAHYETLAEKGLTELAPKLSRNAFDHFLSGVGQILVEESARLVSSDSELKRFLERNPLPPCIKGQLANEFRAYALLLHALNQWVVVRKLEIDCALVGGSPKIARNRLRRSATVCMVAKTPLAKVRVELHHPVRDGRPPIPLSPEGHKRVDGVMVLDEDDHHGRSIVSLRNQGKLGSWIALRTGAVLEQGAGVDFAGRKNPKSFAYHCKLVARRAMSTTGFTAAELLSWLDRYGLGQADELSGAE